MAAQSCSASFWTRRCLRYPRALISVDCGIGDFSGLSAPSAFRYSRLRASLKISATSFPSSCLFRTNWSRSIQLVVVAFILGEDLQHRLQPRRRIERTGRYRDRVMAIALPEQRGAAIPAKAPARETRGGEPGQALILDEPKLVVRHRRIGPEVAVPTATLTAMADDDTAQRWRELEAN